METTEGVTTQQSDSAPNIAVEQLPGTAAGGEPVDGTGTSTPGGDQSRTDADPNAEGDLDELQRQASDGRKAAGKVNTRFREMTDKIRELEARDRVRDELLERLLRGGVPQGDQRQQRQAVDQDPRPDRNDPQWQDVDYETYASALSRWEARDEFRQLTAARERTAQAHQAREQTERILNDVVRGNAERFEKFQKEFPDLAEEVANSDAPLHPVASFITQMDENGPQVLHELVRQPELAARLNRARSPIEMALMIGRISGAVKQKSAAPQIPSAPPAARTTGSRASSSQDTPPEDPEAYFKWANARFGV